METAIHQSSISAGLCEKYYELKSKVRLAETSFDERCKVASSLRKGLKDHDLYHYRRSREESEISINKQGIKKVNLASNDYLNFTKHPLIIDASRKVLNNSGTGSGSVPMLSGTHKVHKLLEIKLASFTGYESAITYNSGFAANVGVLSALLTTADIAVLDMSVHASIVDGCYATNKTFFKHNDCESLKIALRKASAFKNKLVVVDGVYSMDGDIARLDEIIAIAHENNAWVMIDESHAIGVIGEKGRGTQSYHNIRDKAEIITASMGKAMGGMGGFVAASEEVISLLELTSRTFIFSTSIPPNTAAALVKAIDILEVDDHAIQKLHSNIRRFNLNMESTWSIPGEHGTPIFPLIINNESKLMHMCTLLYREGIFANPVFYPVVPRKHSRIRISLTSYLDAGAIDYASEKINHCAKKAGL